jgi:hypothetical protein
MSVKQGNAKSLSSCQTLLQSRMALGLRVILRLQIMAKVLRNASEKIGTWSQNLNNLV